MVSCLCLTCSDDGRTALTFRSPDQMLLQSSRDVASIGSDCYFFDFLSLGRQMVRLSVFWVTHLHFFLCFFLLLIRLSEFPSNLLQVLFFFLVAPFLTSLATAKSSREPVLVDTGLLTINQDVSAIDPATISPVVSHISCPALAELNESISARL